MNTNQTEGKATKICEHHKLTYCKNCYGYKCNKCGLSVFTCKLGGDEWHYQTLNKQSVKQ